jgi:thiol-disulfide isomerase/thioredoxin
MLIPAMLMADTYTRESFDEKLNEMIRRETAVSLCWDYARNSEDGDLLHHVLETWLWVDENSARRYGESAWRGSQTAETAWIRGYLAENADEKVRFAREAIKRDAEGISAYRLLLETYESELFGGDSESLAESWTQDQGFLETYIALGAPNAKRIAYRHALYTGDHSAARGFFDAAREEGARWATHPNEQLSLLLQEGREKEAMEALDGIVDGYRKGGYIENEEMAQEVREYFLKAIYSEIGDYESCIALDRERIARNDTEGARYDLACALNLSGDREAAFEELAKALEMGYREPLHMQDDPDLAGLHEDERWAALMEKAESNAREARGPAREKLRETVLATALEKEAPDWTLPDHNGKNVKLSDLRGELVILDFWATWCSPCRMAMPLIDQWIREEMPEGVRVFSINVWEKIPLKARLFMEDNDYSMELLFGDNELTGAYGVKGIPYICAIDPEGVIRFEESGYSPELGDKLAIWAEELLP